MTLRFAWAFAAVFAVAGKAQEAKPAAEVTAVYRLAPEDQITIHALEAEEIADKPIRIGLNGMLELPLVGRIHAAGMTVEELEQELNTRLKVYIKDPEATVTVQESRVQTVSVIGSVGSPGMQPVKGKKTLIEMLSAAGGTRADAGYRVKVTRKLEHGRIPLKDAQDDATGQFSVAEVNVRDIMDASHPEQNVEILPEDIISVPRADMVYVIGDVAKSGGIVLGDQKTVSVLQSLSISGGLQKTAKPTEAKIMRLQPNSAERTEIPVDLKALLAGKLGDVRMQAEDILFVPTSLKKDVALKTLEAVTGSGITAVLYRLP